MLPLSYWYQHYFHSRIGTYRYDFEFRFDDELMISRIFFRDCWRDFETFGWRWIKAKEINLIQKTPTGLQLNTQNRLIWLGFYSNMTLSLNISWKNIKWMMAIDLFQWKNEEYSAVRPSIKWDNRSLLENERSSQVTKKPYISSTFTSIWLRSIPMNVTKSDSLLNF